MQKTNTTQIDFAQAERFFEWIGRPVFLQEFPSRHSEIAAGKNIMAALSRLAKPDSDAIFWGINPMKDGSTGVPGNSDIGRRRLLFLDVDHPDHDQKIPATEETRVRARDFFLSVEMRGSIRHAVRRRLTGCTVERTRRHCPGGLIPLHNRNSHETTQPTSKEVPMIRALSQCPYCTTRVAFDWATKEVVFNPDTCQIVCNHVVWVDGSHLWRGAGRQSDTNFRWVHPKFSELFASNAELAEFICDMEMQARGLDFPNEELDAEWKCEVPTIYNSPGLLDALLIFALDPEAFLAACLL